MKARLLKAPKLPEPTNGTIRIGDQVVRRGANDRMIVVGRYGTWDLHCQFVLDGSFITCSKRELEQVIEDGRVLTHRDLT